MLTSGLSRVSELGGSGWFHGFVQLLPDYGPRDTDNVKG